MTTNPDIAAWAQGQLSDDELEALTGLGPQQARKPMLQPIEKSNLTDGQKFKATMAGWSAVCTDTGAHLTTQRNGRGWILIIPASPGDLLDPGDDWTRRRFKAGDEAEAIEIGNAKLQKAVAK